MGRPADIVAQSDVQKPEADQRRVREQPETRREFLGALGDAVTEDFIKHLAKDAGTTLDEFSIRNGNLSWKAIRLRVLVEVRAHCHKVLPLIQILDDEMTTPLKPGLKCGTHAPRKTN